ncbi:N-acetyl-gamma-glutamyl-phosphate reductase [Granulicella arctica]|uniref:N-acetyl-gamma-glutamyl-phosphate reductase n=1 Tax=Granulicella arctica TaxID=940613 RepID=UPI0021E00203|nr:N-acetyl-gamma-glutamyl-phosphate reductase [Granulicella arctica]
MANPAVNPHIAVAGVSGYAGAELARLLLHHPRLATVTFYGRAGEPSIPLTELHPQLVIPGRVTPQVLPFDWEKLAADHTDILFLALPHEQSREFAPEALARGIRVIDLSGAWRLQHEDLRAIYKLTDADPALAATLQAEAVYGAPELHRDGIATARLVANPGCYATSIILALAPLVESGLVDIEHGIICDSKSGVSGAGKAATAKTHFMYAADNLSAYNVFGHRHMGELLEQLHLEESQIQFTPHLLPIPRGILSTIYLRFLEPTTPEAVTKVFADFYKASPLVRLHPTPSLPQIQYVVRTNYCDLGFELAKDGKRLVIVSCLDNLLKGAAGQAVENMNLMCGWPEQEGLL